MSTIWRVRVEKEILDRANQVADRLGTSPQEMVRMFLAKVANSGRVPLELDPNYDELIFDKDRRNKILASLDDSEGW